MVWSVPLKEMRMMCSCFAGEEDKHPIANAGADIVTRVGENVTLNGIESWDDRNIIKYEWTLQSGNNSVEIKVTYSNTLLRC